MMNDYYWTVYLLAFVKTLEHTPTKLTVQHNCALCWQYPHLFHIY